MIISRLRPATKPVPPWSILGSAHSNIKLGLKPSSLARWAAAGGLRFDFPPVAELTYLHVRSVFEPNRNPPAAAHRIKPKDVESSLNNFNSS